MEQKQTVRPVVQLNRNLRLKYRRPKTLDWSQELLQQLEDSGQEDYVRIRRERESQARTHVAKRGGGDVASVHYVQTVYLFMTHYVTLSFV